MARHLYLLPVLLFAASAQAQNQPANSEIVVTGTRLSDTRKALEDCIRRKCPPNEDIDATLAHAENLFVAGEYQEARATTRKSISRNDRHARTHPLPVSDLYRVHSRVSAHLGEGSDYERSTYAIRRALKEGLPDEDVRILGADLEVAGMQAALHRIDEARATYRSIERKAAEIGRPDLAGIARLRGVWLSQLEGNTDTARRKLRGIADDRGPGMHVPRLAALALLARLDRSEGKTDSSDAFIEEMKRAGFVKPTLLYSPPIEMNNLRADAESGSATRLMATDTFDDKWVDVGFWVQPNGRVSDIEIIRKSGKDNWTAPVLKAIAGRIYSPIEGTGTGTYRVERYSYTSHWAKRTGTRIRQRSQDARIEMLDLTAEAPPTP